MNSLCTPKVQAGVASVLLHRVGSLPHLAAILDKGQPADCGEERTVATLDEHTVVPFAGAHQCHALAANLPQILSAHGQVGRVYLESLSAAALDALAREETCGVLQRIGSALLVGEQQPVDACLGTRIGSALDMQVAVVTESQGSGRQHQQYQER